MKAWLLRVRIAWLEARIFNLLDDLNRARGQRDRLVDQLAEHNQRAQRASALREVNRACARRGPPRPIPPAAERPK